MTATARIPARGLAAIAVLLSALVLVLTLLLVARLDPARAAQALWEGSVGSRYALLSATLVRATPLALTGLAVTLAFRGGVLNIGAEGQLLVGAAAATAVGLVIGDVGGFGIVLVLTCGAIAGAAWAGVATLLRTRFGVLEVISTLMLNFIAQYLVSYLVRGPMQEPTHIYPQTSELAPALRLPTLGASRAHLGTVLGAIATLGAAWWLHRTAAGFRLRASGANPHAARITGRIDVERVTAIAFLVSGAIAGLAGASEVGGVTYALYENLSPGYGYTAIAVALAARLEPLLVLPSALFFGALESGGAAMQRNAGVPSVVVAVLEAAIVLAAVTLGMLRTDREQS